MVKLTYDDRDLEMIRRLSGSGDGSVDEGCRLLYFWTASFLLRKYASIYGNIAFDRVQSTLPSSSVVFHPASHVYCFTLYAERCTVMYVCLDHLGVQAVLSVNQVE